MNYQPIGDDNRRASFSVPVRHEEKQVRNGPAGQLALHDGYASPYEQEKPAFDFLYYFGLIQRHRVVIIAIMTAMLVLGYAVTYLATPIYRASATIQIDREAQKVLESNNSNDRGAISDLQFYQTEYELLKSRSLAERVVGDLDLANQPGFLRSAKPSSFGKLRELMFGKAADKKDIARTRQAAIGRVMQGLSVQPVPSSSLVRISYDDPNPAWAQKVANAIGDAFIQTNLERRYNATAYARTFLQDQLAKIKLKLEQSERGLIAYATKQQIVNFDDKQSPLAAADLMSINGELAKVRAERIRNEQLWKQAETTDGLGLAQILGDQSITTLRDKRAVLEADYQDKLSMFKPSFPDMMKLRAQIKEIDRQIKSSVSVIKSSIQARFEASQQQEAMLIKQLEKNTNTVLDVQGRNIEYTILHREVDTNRTLYNALLQRYKDVGVAGGVGTNNIAVVDTAQVPGSSYYPSLSKNLSLAALLGALFATLAVYILELLDDTFKTPEDVESVLRMPVIGMTPLLVKGQTVGEAIDDPRSPLSEAYRSMRTSLQFSTEAGAPKVLLVTSSRPAEGKSTTSLNLAKNFAQLSLNVLLVDADLRKPSLHKTLGTDNDFGLSNYLTGAEKGSGKLFRPTSTPGLTFMTSGPLPPNPAELLTGGRLEHLLELGYEKFDMVILDGPPVMGLADALLLASAASATLVVVGAGETRRSVAEGACKRLHFARARMIGAVLSKFDAKKAGAAYGYSYGYGDTDYYAYGAPPPALASPPSPPAVLNG